MMLAGILGHSLHYTLSPLMHTTAAELLRIPFRYGVFDFAPELLEDFIPVLRSQDFVGANITIPHKVSIASVLDSLDEEAKQIGAVNTVVNTGGHLRGYNTDVIGIRESLMSLSGAIKGASVLVLGAGGAARAILHSLTTGFSPGRIFLYNRTRSHADQLAASIRKDIACTILDAEQLVTVSQEVKLIINTTSVGMGTSQGTSPLPELFIFSREHIVFDVIYNPLRTVLLQRAEECGAAVIGGAEMLIQQGAAAFQLWTGKRFPVNQIRNVVLAELRKRGN
jgi:shikimate dehydrogenase